MFTTVLARKKINLGKGSSFVLCPVPAQRLLIRNKSYPALRVLNALCLHLGRGENWVSVSYGTLEQCTGMSRKTVSEGLKVLEKLCIIGVKRSMQSRVKANTNEYFIQDYAYRSKDMAKIGNGYFPAVGMCLACLKDVYPFEVAKAERADFHKRCGGEIHVPGAPRDRIIYTERVKGKFMTTQRRKFVGIVNPGNEPKA
jgi:hypothetical protein